MRSLFGDDLNEYELEVIVDSGLARAEWETLSRQLRDRSTNTDVRSFKNRIRQALKAAGVAASVLPTLTRLTFNHVRRSQAKDKRLRDEEPDDASYTTKFQRLADDIDTSSLLNFPNDDDMSNQKAITPGSGLNKGLTETPVDPVPWNKIARGPPDYQYASLPYTWQTLIRENTNVTDVSFRMTSPLDPFPQSRDASDLNTGAGTALAITSTANDGRVSGLVDVWGASARWYDFYASMYNFYHVVKCRWWMTMENLSAEPMYVHMTYYNDITPPLNATNEDIMNWRECESHLVGTHHHLATQDLGEVATRHEATNYLNVESGPGNDGMMNAKNATNGTSSDYIQSRGTGPILKLSGSYAPGDFQRQIRLDSEVENWTSVDANPSLPERLLLRFKPFLNQFSNNSANSFNRTLKWRVTFRCEYLVEFKELKSTLRWPIERQPLIATIQANPNADDEELTGPSYKSS